MLSRERPREAITEVQRSPFANFYSQTLESHMICLFSTEVVENPIIEAKTDTDHDKNRHKGKDMDGLIVGTAVTIIVIIALIAGILLIVLIFYILRVKRKKTIRQNNMLVYIYIYIVQCFILCNANAQCKCI